MHSDTGLISVPKRKKIKDCREYKWKASPSNIVYSGQIKLNDVTWMPDPNQNVGTLSAVDQLNPERRFKMRMNLLDHTHKRLISIYKKHKTMDGIWLQSSNIFWDFMTQSYRVTYGKILSPKPMCLEKK
jgi:hypothetical protein